MQSKNPPQLIALEQGPSMCAASIPHPGQFLVQKVNKYAGNEGKHRTQAAVGQMYWPFRLFSAHNEFVVINDLNYELVPSLLYVNIGRLLYDDIIILIITPHLKYYK